MNCSVSNASTVAKAPNFEPGNQARKGIKMPRIVCSNCGEEKSAEYFPKRGGRYKEVKSTDPRRYAKQCKRCAKPTRPGQKREDVPEVKPLPRKRAGKASNKTKKRMAREARRKLTAREYKQKVREETRIQSMLYLAEKGCEECGERDPRKLEYDHKNPDDKKRVIADLITDGYSWSAPVLVGEVAKCRVICSNCHRVHTIKQQGYYAFEAVQIALGKLAARYKFKL